MSKYRNSRKEFDPDQPRDEQGRWSAEGGGGSNVDNYGNRSIGTTSEGDNIYDIQDATDLEKKYSNIAVSIRGRDKGKIIASNNSTGHSDMVVGIDGRLDDYVRFSRSYERGEYILEANVDYAAVAGNVADFESTAMGNIYKASERMVNKGLNPSVRLRIYTGEKPIMTTVKGFILRGVIERLVSRLKDETIKAVALPPRDHREPGWKRKALADARLYSVIERIFKTQKARLSVWALLQSAITAGMRPPDDWNSISDETMRDLVINLVEARQDGIRLFDEQVQTGIDYTATNARAAKRAREYAGKLIEGIDKTTEDAIRQTITAFAETPGMTMRDVIERIPLDTERARRIAVTEITRAYADGELEAGIELQNKYPDVAVVKTWFTNNDEKVCPICEPLDGKEIDFDDGWSTGGEGDPDGLQGPPAHPNCRCWIQTRTKI